MSFECISSVIEKWKLEELMDIIRHFEDELADKTHHKMHIGNDYQTILVHIAGKSILTIREILVLCAHGFPDGALSLGRNLYEQMMITAFLELHKEDQNFQEYVDDYFLSYNAQRNKYLKDINKYLSIEDQGVLDTEREELKTQTQRRIKGDYWWTGFYYFGEIVDFVINKQADEKFRSFLGLHHARYKRACMSLHSSCNGNLNRIGNHSDFHIIDTSATIHGHSTSLIYATVSLIYIVGVMSNYFQLDLDTQIKQLNELAVYYQSEEKDDFEKMLEGE